MRIRMMLAAVAATAMAAVPMAATAAASGDADTLTLGYELHLTGPDTTAGTFVASGAVQDAGASSVEHIAVTPLGHHDRARMSGDQTFHGTGGSIVTHFTEVIEDFSTTHPWATGQFEVVSGTGAYAGLRGHGTFLIVVDLAGNHLIGSAKAQVR